MELVDHRRRLILLRGISHQGAIRRLAPILLQAINHPEAVSRLFVPTVIQIHRRHLKILRALRQVTLRLRVKTVLITHSAGVAPSAAQAVELQARAVRSCVALLLRLA